MSGTSLVILAMYSTVNVVGRGGAPVSGYNASMLLFFLISAATLTFSAMCLANMPPRRIIPKGPTLVRAKRRFNGPGERRR